MPAIGKGLVVFLDHAEFTHAHHRSIHRIEDDLVPVVDTHAIVIGTAHLVPVVFGSYGQFASAAEFFILDA